LEPRAQKTARAMVQVLKAAGVKFAVLGEMESCTGDSARRAGNEYLFYEMALVNIETLNEVNPPRIVATCPHCFHTLGKEYPQFGGNYDVVHHTDFLRELMENGRLKVHANGHSNVTFHDPCYLGRHNNVYDEPRYALQDAIGGGVVEMPRSRNNSFCCGAGGAQFWKEEEHGSARVNLVRYSEAKATGAETLAVGCPFCMRMFADASQDEAIQGGPEVKDVVEIIAESLGLDY
ncbi:MAG: (Fe-S)-binding protein, partial [Chloroflexi bacterium]|nr:(Fe-S)-binding protein [Chloroflexota bacterium]